MKKRNKKIWAVILALCLMVPLFCVLFASPVVNAEGEPTLRKGDRGNDVKALQQMLTTAGFSCGTADGVFGTNTYDAVIAFQTKYDLTTDGIVGKNTWNKLNEVVSNAAPSGERQVLRQGMSGEDVKEVQTILINNKFLNDVADGKFGSKTKAAVVAFQQACGLTADGIVGPKSWDALDKVKNQTLVVTPPPAATSAPSNPDTPAQTKVVYPTVDGYSFYRMQTSTVLRMGDSGLDVKDLQAALKYRGYFNGTIDGVFGTATFNAVKAWQSYLRLDVDGLAGNYTLASLYSNMGTNQVGEIKVGRLSVNMNWPLTKPEWSTVNTTLTRGSIFTVVDVQTGYTYQMKRMGGSLHADSEPLTQLDTKTLLKCYNNKWSWDRRPIWVCFNGHRYAASTNGMPHGSQTIYDNDMTGQVCIHFVGSKTHGSAKVCPLHQAAINKAYATTSVPGIN